MLSVATQKWHLLSCFYNVLNVIQDECHLYSIIKARGVETATQTWQLQKKIKNQDVISGQNENILVM